MLSKNPLDLVGKGKLSKEEVIQALRLGIIAELDAVSLYEQLGLLIDDEGVRKVFLDIAKEEKTHVGEFLTMLKSLDSEQASELIAGAKEVKELTGIKTDSDPNPSLSNNAEVNEVPEGFERGEWEAFLSSFKEALESSRRLRKLFKVINYGSGTPAVIAETVNSGGVISSEGKLLPLKELSVKFSVQRRHLETLRRFGKAIDLANAKYAAFKLGSLEDELILKGDPTLALSGLLSVSGSESLGVSDWSVPGNAVKDIAKAVSTLIKEGVPEPYVLILNPVNYSALIAVHERTGVMELSRVKALVSDVVSIPAVPEDITLLISTNPSVADIAIGTDLTLNFLGPEDGKLVFRAWETVALRVKYPKGIVILKKE